jgi:hypothetical protein
MNLFFRSVDRQVDFSLLTLLLFCRTSDRYLRYVLYITLTCFVRISGVRIRHSHTTASSVGYPPPRASYHGCDAPAYDCDHRERTWVHSSTALSGSKGSRCRTGWDGMAWRGLLAPAEPSPDILVVSFSVACWLGRYSISPVPACRMRGMFLCLNFLHVYARRQVGSE